MVFFNKVMAAIAKLTQALGASVFDYRLLAKQIMKSSVHHCMRRDWSYISHDFEITIKKYEEKLNAKIK